MSYTPEHKESEPASDDIYSQDRSVERVDSLKKRDIESSETDIKAGRAVEDSDVLGDEEKPGKVKAFVATHAKQIRIGIHALVAAVMTG